ncbi:tRNA synthetases class I (M)-domain-containing protein [Staphylotrichum tortipilum]|uniref:Probable methionine--tRNA ligase, mitochondrial n=1 Tax=Staphylotrichum tortipilum TaxID=2831512 RepID=A0AAN6MV77_9PEZI|nr:tRNA synthetases class I (M)-domain-containing protein [Staphylotrichum longicolle]
MELARAVSARRLLRWQSAWARPRGWVCSACSSRGSFPAAASRRYSSDQASTASATPPPAPGKPYYVTTPIFYVNAAPHIGHMYSMVLADVFKRWHTLLGKQAFLCTGTDEHGMKVQLAAAAAKLNPKQLCDENAAKFEELAQLVGIDYDRFIRTTDPDHLRAVEHFWILLQERGFVYETKHEGWYSVSDECFYPESQIIKSQDPFSGEIFVASAETKNKVEWVEEKNYCFRMKAFKDRLLDFYKANPGWIEPAYRLNEVVDWVTNHLEDLSISRPAQRLGWGIRVPHDPSQTIYVWVDALINYLTAAGFPASPLGDPSRAAWPADLQVIGKDILRFHCVYWPALLMALDLPLPKKMLAHSHWTLNSRKMSKSLGNVVNPVQAVSRWGADGTRFYLLFEGGIADDASYNNEVLMVKYKKYLQGGIGNLLSRVARSPRWNLAEVVESSLRSEPGTGLETSRPELRTAMQDLEAAITDLPSRVAACMAKHDPVTAIREVFKLVTSLNEFLTVTQPWDLIQVDNPAARLVAEQVIFLAAEGVRVMGILLQPFMPGKATQLLNSLGVADDRRTFGHTALRGDPSYGVPREDLGRGRTTGLFPPLVGDIDFRPGRTRGGRRGAKTDHPILVTET